MYGAFVSLALLGLAAIDPIGIAIMPILLAQKHPYKRAALFLSGSFCSLMIMGLVFAKGFGAIVLRFEHRNTWFVQTVELIAAAVLLIIALTLYIKLRTGKTSLEPADKTRRWLQLGGWRLFLAGAVLVAVQSLIDLVFVIAMIRVGQLELSNIGLVGAVATYAVTALLLQALVVGAFAVTPMRHRTHTLAKVHTLLGRYAYQAVVIVSILLSYILLALALKA
jgi:hypothetical protein